MDDDQVATNNRPAATALPSTSRDAVAMRLLVGVLLALIMAYGIGLRLVGQNWDDSSHTHPDEMFLTLLTLPQIGGSNNFTDDFGNFPTQQILVNGDRRDLNTHYDLLTAPGLRIGAVEGSFAANAATWLARDREALVFPDMWMAQEALAARQVDALIVAEGSPMTGAEVYSQQAIQSKDLQDLACRHRYPASDGLGGFFDSRCSPLNPHNAGQSFFVYGTLPILLAHFGGELLQEGMRAGIAFFDFQAGHLVWRGVSMIFDSLAILVIFLLGRRVQDKWVGLLAALFYASAPLAIQLAHFGTVNAIACFWVALALYFAVGAQQHGKRGAYWWFGVACGAAVASRINLAPLAGIIVVAAAAQMLPALNPGLAASLRRRILTKHVFGLILAGLGAFLAFRIMNPYAFAGPGFFNILPNDRWVETLQRVSSAVSGPQETPPNWQWLAKSSIVHPLKDMLLWGMGITFGALGWIGWCWAALRLLRLRNNANRLMLLLVWVGGYHYWMARLFVVPIRYFLPLYCALAVLGAWLLVELWRNAQSGDDGMHLARLLSLLLGGALGAAGWGHALLGHVDATAITAIVASAALVIVALLPGLRRGRVIFLGSFAVIFAIVWGLMRAGMYQHQTTLVRASRYLFEQVPSDFSMRIDGADATTPLINIALHNTGIPLPDFDGDPFTGANFYREGEPSRHAFIAPASGAVSSVYAPHLGDPHDDSELERIEVRLRRQGDESILMAGALESDLPRDAHSLGNAYNIPFLEPVLLAAGESYTLEIEIMPGSGDVLGSGSVVSVEGPWDNRVTGVNACKLPAGMSLADDLPAGMFRPNQCEGKQAWYALVNSIDQAMAHPVDDQFKHDDILRTLEQADYVSIASNRFYDHQPRNLMRWPLTTLYYQKLFSGELGFALELAAEQPYEWGPWRVSDQWLPHYNSPAWLQELEADEAAHVYDHPAAYIFRKTDAYSPEKAAAIFQQISLRQRHELQADDNTAVELGVIYWNTEQAEQAPTSLMFTPAERETQTEGGTWSQRFFSDSIANRNQLVGVLAWYAAIFIIGALSFPLVFAIFPSLADGGYGVSKLAGMLLAAWLAWAVSSLKVPLWSQAGLLFALALIALLSAALGLRNRERLADFLRAHWRRLAWMELLSLAAFLFMIGIRLTNPDLWHTARGGEKPMDFAYLNGVLRSTTFPPIDPWFAGGFINYYYFGYVLLGVPTLILGIVPAFAYNLMIPTVFCMTGMGAFSAAFNITDRLRKSHGDGSRKRSRRVGSSWVAGVMALLLCVVLGNLDTVRVVGHGLARLGGYSRPEGLEQFLVDEHLQANNFQINDQAQYELATRALDGRFFDSLRYELHHSADLVASLAQGMGRLLGGEQLPIGSDRWYWAPSRVLAETPGVGGGAITEMPYFTFLYGDLHAHMINMPLILLTALALFSEVMQAGRDRRGLLERLLALAILALTVGVMQALNTWDYPSMMLFAIAGLGYAWYLRWQGSFRPIPDARFYAALLGGLIVLSALLTALASGAQPQVAQIALAARTALIIGVGAVVALAVMRSWLSRSSALDLAAHVGGFALLAWAFALPYTSWYAANYDSIRLWHDGKTPLWAYLDIHGLFLFMLVSLLIWDTAHWARNTRVRQLRAKWSLARLAGLGSVVAVIVAIVMTFAHYQVAMIALPLICWIAWLFFRSGQSRALRFALVLAGLALAMTLGVEIIVIGGDIGRQNTVFKFYIQVWLLLSVVGGVAFACLLQAVDNFSVKLRWLWAVPCISLILIASLYPVMATRGRSLDRMAPETPLTLNGNDYMLRAEHHQWTQPAGEIMMIPLSVDHALIRWLQENVEGSPVIMEARHEPSEYQYNARIAINTGLPSVLGWNFHQRQQRTLHSMSDMIFQRERSVKQFYNTGNIDVAVDLLWMHRVEYIIVSDYERAHATAEGLAKFQQMVDRGLLSLAYAIDSGAIYHVRQDALLHYLMERQ